LCEDEVEVVNEKIEHVSGRAVGLSKLFGCFSIDGGRVPPALALVPTM